MNRFMISGKKRVERARGGTLAMALGVTVGMAALTASQATPNAAQASSPRLTTNQSYVEKVTRMTSLDVKKPMSVFEFVHRSLPNKVTVYPSENYYYFSFMHQGQEYVGNLRLDIADRDKGLVHFAYFKKYTEWQRGADPTYGLLSKADGVTIKKAGRLAYDISFKKRNVRFELIDLSKTKPPKAAVSKDESYLGPVFDESGIQFYLIFNKRLKVFHYVLNEAVPIGETLMQSEVSKHIQIGRRTGFAYYMDPFVKRKVLIGVHAANSRVNNYFDGPFDQLPDNFIKGDALRNAIELAEPGLKGKIDRLGNSPDGATRYFIGPYMHYEDEYQMSAVSQCMDDKTVTRRDYALCFVIEQEDDETLEANQPDDMPVGAEQGLASRSNAAKP